MGRLVSRAMASLVLAAAVSCHDGTGPADTITLLTAGTPLSDVVNRGGSKLYAVVVSAGGVYRVSLTGLTDDVDLYAFDADATFNTPISCLIDHTLFFGTLAEDCAAVATGDTVYLGVSGADALAATVSYTIEVRLQQTSSLTLSAPLEDSVPGGGARFYQAGITPGSSYTVSVTEPATCRRFADPGDRHHAASGTTIVAARPAIALDWGTDPPRGFCEAPSIPARRCCRSRQRLR